jgi:hypothetical protein
MLIRRMVRENALWGQERIAYELQLKLGIRVSQFGRVITSGVLQLAGTPRIDTANGFSPAAGNEFASGLRLVHR